MNLYDVITASPGSGAVHFKVTERAWTQEARKSLTVPGPFGNKHRTFHLYINPKSLERWGREVNLVFFFFFWL